MYALCGLELRLAVTATNSGAVANSVRIAGTCGKSFGSFPQGLQEMLPELARDSSGGDRLDGSRSRLQRVGRALAIVSLALAVAYGAAIVWLVSQETRLVFAANRPLQTALPSVPYQQIDIPRDDRARQYAWVFRQGGSSGAAAPWVLFLHGNAATIASRVNISHYEHLRALGLNVVAPEYRGYGGLPGTPSESAVDADARAAYAYLRGRERADRIIIYGWSLGSAVAVDLASGVPAAAVILEGAPASLVAIGQRRYPMFPIRLLMRNPFESILKVGRIRAPMLFLHSPEDTLIPIAEARRLYDAAPSPKTFVEVPGGHIHSSDTDPAAFFGAVRTFLQQNRILPE